MFAKVPQSQSEAVKSTQTLMNLLDPTKRVVVDGIVGEQTRRAYGNLRSEARNLVVELASARNESIIASLKEVPKPEDNGVWVSQSAAASLIRDAVSRYGKIDLSGSSTEEYLQWKLDLEALKARRPEGVYYSATHRNSYGYTGMYQIGKSAYEDVLRSGRIQNLPVYGVAATDPLLSTAMALVYSQLCYASLRAGSVRPAIAPYKGPITKEVLYSAYNQGVAGFMLGAKNALQQGGQSTQATPIIASALNFVRSQMA